MPLMQFNRLRNISIHALREEGDAFLGVVPEFVLGISIHALREEGDSVKQDKSIMFSSFLSTPSARRATQWLLR